MHWPWHYLSCLGTLVALAPNSGMSFRNGLLPAPTMRSAYKRRTGLAPPSRGWHVITSGYPSTSDSSTTRSAGVMVMLHPSIPVQDIRWSVGTPGRSHMVHFSFKGSPFVIINCYQHTKHKGSTAVERWATQKQVLDKLSAEITAVSNRTNLMVSGTLMPV